MGNNFFAARSAEYRFAAGLKIGFATVKRAKYGYAMDQVGGKRSFHYFANHQASQSTRVLALVCGINEFSVIILVKWCL